MAAGLPGTGIGGMFFVLSAYFMLVVEIHRTLRGRSSLARWRIVLRNVAIASAMVAAVTAAIWLAHRALYPAPPASAGGKGASGTARDLLPFSPVLVTTAVLAAVLAAAYVLRLVAGRRR